VVMLLVLGGSALFAPLLAPHNPYDLKSFSLMDRLLPPVWEDEGDDNFLLGTDEQGRCILSSIMYGLRSSFLVGFGVVFISLAFGALMGLCAGYFGGVADSAIGRIMDMLLAFPSFLIAVLILGIVKHQGILVLIMAMSICSWVRYARVARGNVLVVKKQEFVDASKTIGAGNVRILLMHILPNSIGTLFVIGSVDLGMIIVQESTLSFLGIGVPLTMPSLGMMISSGYTQLFSGVWWVVTFPGLVLSALVLAVNLLGDWLRSELNPRLNK